MEQTTLQILPAVESTRCPKKTTRNTLGRPVGQGSSTPATGVGGLWVMIARCALKIQRY